MMLRKILNKSSKGATIIEYALIAALVAIVAISAMKSVGQQVSTKFSEVNGQLSSVSVSST